MYCTNCGIKIKSGKFCPNCGAPVVFVQQNTQPVSAPANTTQSATTKSVSAPALPEGMYADANGALRWEFRDGSIKRLFCMDENRICYKAVQIKDEESLGSAFKELVKGGIALAADNIVMNSDSYIGQDLPWDFGEESTNCYSTKYEYLKKIKTIPNKCKIKLCESVSSFTIDATPQQYPFVLDYIVSHAPNAKIK